MRFTLFLIAAAASAQLTTEQKVADFRFLAGQYSKHYAPYEWKRQLTGFDALEIGPWLERVRATKDDLDFYEVCTDYISRFNDTHVPYFLPSDFVASLGISVDIYDGKVLIDALNRTALPAARFPFQIGDELVSVDNRPVEELIEELRRYSPAGNVRASRRNAAARLTARSQSRMPHAPDVGDFATIQVRRQSGALESYEVPWLKQGTPLRVGPVPMPRAARSSAAQPTAIDTAMDGLPAYMRPWLEDQYSASQDHAVLGVGARNPIFQLPANFVQRAGRVPADFFFSGTYAADGVRIGYIRIPSYGTLSTVVIQQFETEMAFFQENTDGLIVDNMRNPGGFLCFGESLVQRMVPYQFHATGYELRATWARVNGFYNNWTFFRSIGAESWIVDLYGSMYEQMLASYRENRGRTGPLSLCSLSLDRDPATDRFGRNIAYAKPTIMLVDEFSTSTGDSVPAMFQDAKRGPLLGWRTNGAGGTNTSVAGGAWSESFAGMTLGLMTRKEPIVTSDHPTAHYIENIGVRPDIEVDYMTRDNLLQGGRPFVNTFTAALVRLVRGQ